MYRIEIRLLLLLFFLSLFSTVVLGISVTSMRMEANGFPVAYVSGANAQLVDLLLTVDTDRDYLVLDLSEINTEIGSSYRNVNVPLSTCLHNETTNISTCLVSDLPLRPANTSIVLRWELWKGGSKRTGNKTLTFQLDNTAPTVTSMATELCREGKCFIGSGLIENITIQLEDTTGSFNQHLIFYKLGTFSAPVKVCDGSTCKGSAIVSCGDNTALDMKVVNGPNTPSQDDAGNPVTNPGEVTRVWCDARPPRIINVTAKGTGMFDMVTNDGELLITAYIEEGVTKGSITAMTHDIQFNVSENASVSAECSWYENEIQKCDLSIGNLVAGRNKRVPLVFTDEVGHNSTSMLQIPRILKVSNETEQPSFFSAKATAVSPERINRVALQLAMDNAMEYPHFINYEIQRTTSGAKILNQEIDTSSCQVVWDPKNIADPYRRDNDENWTIGSAVYKKMKIFYPTADWDEENRIDATFLEIEDVNERDADTILMRCNLSLTVEKNDVLYKQPEEETLYWPINLRNSALGTPGQAFLTRINQQEDKINGGVYQLIGYANQLMSTFAQLCEIQGILNTISTQGMSMEAMGTLLMMTGAGANLAQGGSNLQGKIKAYSMNYMMGKVGTLKVKPGDMKPEDRGIGSKMCEYVHCNTAKELANGEHDNWFTNADNDFLNFEDTKVGNNRMLGPYLQDLNRPDVKNSLIMSLATQCWGGVVYNLNKYRVIECGYLQCLKEQSLGGNSVASCDAVKGAAICRFVLGEIFELPYARVLNNLMENIQSIMQAPIGLLFNHLSSGPCADMDYKIGWGAFACHVMQGFRQIEAFRSVTENSVAFTWDASPDLCDLALCEGEDCNRPTNSFLNELFPSMQYGGPALTRQRMLEDWRNEQRKNENQELIEDLKKWRTEKKNEPPTDAMNEYARHAGIKEEERDTFFLGVTGHGDKYCNKDQESCVQDFEYILENGDNPKDADTYKNSNAGGIAGVSKGAIDAFNAINKKKCTAVENCLVDANCRNAETGKRCEDQRAAQKKMDGAMKDYSIADGKLCNKKSNECIDAATAQKNAVDAHKLANAQEWYGFVEGLSGVIAQDMYNSGDLDWATMRGLGSFGESIDAMAEELPFTTTWAENLCNPTGDFGSLTEDDGAVYAWQENTYRAVLTFAAERLPLQERASNPFASRQNLYTVSFVAISPFTDNALTLSLEPGNFKLTDEPVALSRGNTPVSKGFSINSSTVYERVCISFSDPFPDVHGQEQYCRPIGNNMYDRGVVTNETLPVWGVEDPYGGYATDDATAGTNTFGFGGGAT